MDDAELDRTLTDALSVTPSPHFVACVRMRIADTQTAPAVLRWRGRSTALTLRLAAVAASSAAVFLVLALRSVPIQPAGGIEALESRSMVGVPQAPIVASALSLDSSRPSISAATVGMESREIPEVLIDADTRQGLLQLLYSVRERRFEATFDQTPPTPWAMSELTIAPLTIEPLDPPAANNN